MTWTSGQIKHWDSVQELMFAPSYPVFDALLMAVKERLIISGSLTADQIESRYCAPYSFGAFSGAGAQNGIVKFIEDTVIDGWGNQSEFGYTGWVNTTDNGGNWHNSATAPPLWTKEAILAVLGQADYIKIGYPITIDVYRMSPMLASWVRQVYVMLNLFRWRKIRISTLNNPGYDDYYYKQGIGATYPLAVADWDDDWIEANGLIEGTGVYSNGNGGANVSITRSYIKNHTYDAETDQYTHDADLYFYTQKPISSIGDDLWDQQDTDFVENTYSLFGSYTARNMVTGTIDLRELLTDTPPPFIPPDGERYGWEAGGRGVDPPNFAVIKWDVTGGLDYVD